jgi:hypothetical protein
MKIDIDEEAKEILYLGFLLALFLVFWGLISSSEDLLILGGTAIVALSLTYLFILKIS